MQRHREQEPEQGVAEQRVGQLERPERVILRIELQRVVADRDPDPDVHEQADHAGEQQEGREEDRPEGRGQLRGNIDGRTLRDQSEGGEHLEG